MSTPTIASWILTYLIHSTVLLSAAWLFSRTSWVTVDSPCRRLSSARP